MSDDSYAFSQMKLMRAELKGLRKQAMKLRAALLKATDQYEYAVDTVCDMGRHDEDEFADDRVWIRDWRKLIAKTIELGPRVRSAKPSELPQVAESK